MMGDKAGSERGLFLSKGLRVNSGGRRASGGQCEEDPTAASR